MTVKNIFEIRDSVFLRTDPDQHERLVTGIKIYPGAVMYQLSHGKDFSDHYDFEITVERDLTK